VFDRIRERLKRRIGAQQQVLAQALATRDTAQAQVDAAQAALASAQAGLQNAQTALTQAQGAVATAQASRDTAQAQRDAAAQALAAWADAEPINPLPNGHPNPAWRPWKTKLDRLQDELDGKQTALGNAANALAAATNASNAAAAQLSAAQGGVTEAEAALAAAQGRLAQTLTTVVLAQRELATLSALTAELDARAARILAEPLNVQDLEQAGDGELVEALTRRHTRHDLLTHRLHVIQDRAATLSAHDATADNLAALAATIRSWPGTGTDPDLNAVASALEGIAADSRAHRTFSAEQRTDDLAAVAATVRAQAQRISNLLAAASAQRDAAGVVLQRDADALAAINAKAPKR
jgi:hypothetical protein